MKRELCNGCGACCHPVVLPQSRREIEQAMDRDMGGAYVRWWALNILTPLTRREGLALAPWERGNQAMPVVSGYAYPWRSSFYRCAWFDETTRLCTHYEERPDVCRDFPRYGGTAVKPEAALPPMCGYREEQGKEVGPMPEDWQPVLLRRR